MKKIYFSHIILLSVLFLSCQKEIKTSAQEPSLEATAKSNGHKGHLKQTKTFSSEVVQAWINLLRRLFIIEGGSMKMKYQQNRWFAYEGIALYESVVPGMPAYQSLYGQLDQMPVMPSVQHGMAYYWPACANSALACMSRNFFSAFPAGYLASIDSLENALNNEYQNQTNPEELQRSYEFGKEVGRRIFEWSKTDGADAAFVTNYQPLLTGPGYWAPGSPASVVPLWGNVRTLVAGSLDGALPSVPLPYSTDPSSGFYEMAKDVYDVSQTLTNEQRDIALFWADRAGFSQGGHTLSILGQIIAAENVSLDKAALAYAKTGICMEDANIGGWKVKFTYLQIRPITYIRKVLMHTTWNPLFATPAHPEFVSDHCSYGGASAALSTLFGDSYVFTDHSYDYMKLSARSFNSFEEAFEEANLSRYYAGTNYLISTEAAYQLGLKVGLNIEQKLKFLKK